MSNQWLESVARGTLHVYTEHILKIRELTEQSTKQLIVDIGLCLCRQNYVPFIHKMTKNIIAVYFMSVYTHSPLYQLEFRYLTKSGTVTLLPLFNHAFN